jgi:molybdopterin-guanine dinucleotide biosynthesis protein A
MAGAAILAGGLARRMGGADKASLRVGGRTILQRQVDALRPLVDRILLVGYRGAGPIPHDVVPVEDRVAGGGPLAGLDAALAAAHDDILLLACDMPHVQGPLLAHLLALTADADLVVPRTERGYHPLCAAYTQACGPVVRQRLARGQLRMLDLMDQLRVRVVEPDEIARFGDGDELLANVNTLAELDAVESHLSH